MFQDNLKTLRKNKGYTQEEFEVSVRELLGAKIEDEQSKSDVAEQLARINEQLAIKNRRAKRIWSILGIVVVIFVILYLLAFYSLGMPVLAK